MTRTTNIDLEIRCKSITAALGKFFRKYPEYKEAWRETFEYMLNNGVEFLSDELLADGTKQPFTYALHAQHEDNWFYLALIERA